MILHGVNRVTPPRFVVKEPAAKPLGYDTGDGARSAVRKAMLSRLDKSAGVHLWTADGSVVATDGAFVMIHTGAAGLKRIAVSAGIQITPLTGAMERREERAIHVRFGKGRHVLVQPVMMAAFAGCFYAHPLNGG